MRQVRLNAPMRRRCRIALALHLYWMLLPSEARATTGRDVSAHCDAIDYLLKQRHETATWAQLEAALATAFDAAGASSAWPPTVDNWTPLRWRCSVAADTGELSGCVWIIVGSSEHWQKTHGWQTCVYVARCRVPIAGHARDLPAELLTRHVSHTLLTRPWPGQTVDLGAVVAACLERASHAPVCGA